MSPAQKEAYEENKLKMRKAIADPALVNESEEVRPEYGGNYVPSDEGDIVFFTRILPVFGEICMPASMSVS